MPLAGTDLRQGVMDSQQSKSSEMYTTFPTVSTTRTARSCSREHVAGRLKEVLRPHPGQEPD
jgi:hypothetical protein